MRIWIDERAYTSKPTDADRIQTARRTATPRECTIEELIAAIENGQTVVPADFHAVPNPTKTNPNAVSYVCDSKQMFFVDVDNERDNFPKMPIEAALQICEDNRLQPAFWYYTFNSSPDHEKYRLCFLCEEPITDAAQAKRIQHAIMQLFPQHDKACSDLCRLFYGTNKKCVLIDEEQTFSVADIDRIAPQIVSDEWQAVPNDSHNREWLSAHIDEILACIPATEYNTWIRTCAALKREGFPFEVFDNWSRTASNYGDTRYTWDSFNENTPGIRGGTLVELARQYGWNYQRGDDARARQKTRTRTPKPVEDHAQYKNAKVLLTIDFLRLYLKQLGISWRYNLISKQIEVTGDIADLREDNAANTLPIKIMDSLRQMDIKGASLDVVRSYMAVIADQQAFNPVEEYLSRTTWDGIDRLPLLYKALSIDGAQRSQMYVRKWLIQCVALGLNGRKPVGAEGVLVLQGNQGLAKTSFFRNLCPDGLFEEAARIDVSATSAAKDSQISALGKWICELGELDHTTKKDQPGLKAFLTAPFDNLRMPYAPLPIQTPRRTSFCGTVNDEHFLVDSTGSRRYWTVKVTRIDKQFVFNELPQIAPQVWAQVYELYKQNPTGFRLTDDEMEALQVDNRAFELALVGEEDVRLMLDFDMPYDQWTWRAAGDLKRSGALPAHLSTVQIGKVLKKISTDFMNDDCFPETAGRIEKTMKGVKHYLLPFCNFSPL